MAYSSLSTRDLNILEKIKDPESDPSSAVVVDGSLPKDPHCPDMAEYDRVAAKERSIISAVQQTDLELVGLKQKSSIDALEAYKECLVRLGRLISEHPNYASARNNRAQVYRRLYGDGMLVAESNAVQFRLIPNPDRLERMAAANQALSDLDRCVSLLSPAGDYPRLSPKAANILSLAHTQRAAIYYQTSKLLGDKTLDVSTDRRETSWKQLDFEEAASLDFAMGGRYGNETAKGLAVTTNPTAKLCGQMVLEAMKKEYGPGFGE